MAHDVPPIQWTPTPEQAARTTLRRYLDAQGLEDWDHALAWSIEDVDGFWRSISDFFDLRWETAPETFLADASMPGAVWCPGGRISYAEHVFRGKDDPDATAIHFAAEHRPLERWTWGRLREETARIRAGLQALGVEQGDRVCAYLPNAPETIAAFLATASLGAIWSSAAPEFGARSVIDRFTQIEPKVLLAVDGYRYGGRDFDRSAIVTEVHEQVGGRLVRLGLLDGTGWEDGFLGPAGSPLDFVPLPFEHPLWILYSSGTTGLPKPIVHSQGGILLEHVKQLGLHVDAQPGDRIFWFTTTGWMMWNFLVGALLPGAEIVLFDGNPGHAVGSRRADAGDVLRHERRVHRRVHEGRRQAGRGPRSQRAARRRVDRVPVGAGGLRVGRRGARRARLALLHLGRDGRLQRLRRRQPAAARPPR
jgi:acetoacetyl-CoA synthetase